MCAPDDSCPDLHSPVLGTTPLFARPDDRPVGIDASCAGLLSIWKVARGPPEDVLDTVPNALMYVPEE